MSGALGKCGHARAPHGVLAAHRANETKWLTERYEVTSIRMDPEQLLVVSNSSVTESTQAP